jgi:hypothetical protein
MRLAEFELADDARFVDGSSFNLLRHPDWLAADEVPTGLYELPRRTGEAHLFRINHPLGEAIVARAKGRTLSTVEMTFDLTGHDGQVTILNPLKGQSGWLTACLLSIESLGQGEDHLLLSAISDSGTILTDEMSSRLMTVGGAVGPEVAVPLLIYAALDEGIDEQRARVRQTISERNARFFEEEATKLDGWADDLKVGLEREIREIDRQIKEARRAATAALTLEDKLAGQKAVKALESDRNNKRRSLFDAQDRIDEQRAELIDNIEARLDQVVDDQPLFTIRWSIR